MKDRWISAQQQVAEAIRKLVEAGLVSGSSGNVSLRLPRIGKQAIMAITPSQHPYDRMTADHILVSDFEGNCLFGEGIPSSERCMHAAIYRAHPGLEAVVHTHSIYASVLAVRGIEIPPIIDEMIALAGGAVAVANYALPGTAELAACVVEAMGDRKAVLLRHHGLICTGHTLEEAVQLALSVERAAQIFVVASSLGPVPTLPPNVVALQEEIYQARVREEGK